MHAPETKTCANCGKESLTLPMPVPVRPALLESLPPGFEVSLPICEPCALAVCIFGTEKALPLLKAADAAALQAVESARADDSLAVGFLLHSLGVQVRS